MAALPKTASGGLPKEDSDLSTPPKKTSSKKVYSPAKRRPEDFAAVPNPESESSDSETGGEVKVVASHATKRLKSTGEDIKSTGEYGSVDESKEKSDGSGNESEDDVEEKHEIDMATDDEDETFGEEEAEPITCPECGGTPCIWELHGPDVIGVGIQNEWLDEESNNHDYDRTNFDGRTKQELAEMNREHKRRRFISFREFNRVWPQGGRGRGDTVRPPKCCDDKIHNMYPVPPGFTRVGYKSAEERGTAN